MKQQRKLAAVSGANIVPNATATVYGSCFSIAALIAANTKLPTSQQVTQLSNAYCISPDEIDFAFSGGNGVETLTFQVTAVYDDGSTAVVNNMVQASASSGTAIYAWPVGAVGTANASPQTLKPLMVNGREVVALACNMKSSISSSAATASITIYGETRPNV